ncbi:MAG: tyrosine-type recombinase/integrase [Betaproteobacteria bacterium]|nr:tyrosine-type recombinase/integrase [Betaproteobacteria bacterium]
MPLTDTAIRNAKPGAKPTGEATRNPYRLTDAGGMYLEVYPNGSKYWRLKYRYAGKEKRLALGVYPEVTLKEARNRRDAARKLLADGIDPGQAKQADKRARKLSAANSFESVAREWYGKQVHTWVKTHAADVLRRLEANAFPAIGHRPIKEVEPPELLMMARKIESRGAHDLAHRVLQVCGQVFRYGVATGRCTRDPTPDLRGALTPHVKKNQAAVKPEELPDLMRAINTYDQTGDKQTMLALKILALTFVRTNELIGAEWVEFDLDKALWAIPAGRMKMKNEHVVPLSQQAVAILRELQPMAGGSRFVFPGRNRDKPISNNTLLFALYRLGYKGKMTGHGFRAVASTALNEMGFRADVIERQLAHCERNEVRGAYNRAAYLEERRGMMQHWGNYLDAVATGAKILPFQRVA